MAARLSNKAIDHAETKPGALADILSREEWFKNPIPYLGSHSAARVCDRESHVGTGGALRYQAPVFYNVSGLNLKYTTIRHGVARIQRQVEDSRLQQRRIDVAWPQSVIELQFDFTSLSNSLVNQSLEFQ